MTLDGDQVIAVTPHQVTRIQAGAAPGYQMTLGALILKTYLGVGYDSRT